jgi:hypothetical protein
METAHRHLLQPHYPRGAREETSIRDVESFQHVLRAHAHPVVVGQSTPGDDAVRLDQKDRRTGDRTPTRFTVLVDQPPGVYGVFLYVGEDRKLETELLRETGAVLVGIDRDRQDRGPDGDDFREA